MEKNSGLPIRQWAIAPPRGAKPHGDQMKKKKAGWQDVVEWPLMREKKSVYDLKRDKMKVRSVETTNRVKAPKMPTTIILAGGGGVRSQCLSPHSFPSF